MRQDHSHLEPSDDCWFLLEYNPKDRDNAHSMVQNYKKSPSRKGRYEWRYKEKQIESFADMLRATLEPDFLSTTTLVPIPPSKAKDDPEYDDRLLRTLELVGDDLDIRELVIQQESTPAHHEQERPRRPNVLVKNYQVVENVIDPMPKKIALFDDVITTGGHFKPIQSMLVVHCPDVPIQGIFLARRIFGEFDLGDLDVFE